MSRYQSFETEFITLGPSLSISAAADIAVPFSRGFFYWGRPLPRIARRVRLMQLMNLGEDCIPLSASWSKRVTVKPHSFVSVGKEGSGQLSSCWLPQSQEGFSGLDDSSNHLEVWRQAVVSRAAHRKISH